MQTHTRSADLVDSAQMEGCLEAPPPTPATPFAPDASSPQRSADPSFDAAVGASVPPTPHHPPQLFAQPHHGLPSECLSARLAPPDLLATVAHGIVGPIPSLLFLDAHIVTTVLSFDLRRVFAAPDRTQIVRVDPATCVLHAYSALTCLSLFWERTGLLYLYMEGLSLFGGPYEYIWRALLCLEGLMSMRVFACGGPIPLPLSPLPGCA